MNVIHAIYPKNWKEYELIDSGDFEKLERFGEYITILSLIHISCRFNFAFCFCSGTI